MARTLAERFGEAAKPFGKAAEPFCKAAESFGGLQNDSAAAAGDVGAARVRLERRVTPPGGAAWRFARLRGLDGIKG